MSARTASRRTCWGGLAAKVAAGLLLCLTYALAVPIGGCASKAASWPAFGEYYNATAPEYAEMVKDAPDLDHDQKQRRFGAIDSAGRVLREAGYPVVDMPPLPIDTAPASPASLPQAPDPGGRPRRKRSPRRAGAKSASTPAPVPPGPIPFEPAAFLAAVQEEAAAFRDTLKADQRPRFDAALTDLAGLTFNALAHSQYRDYYVREARFCLSQLASETALAAVRADAALRDAVTRAGSRLVAGLIAKAGTAR